MRPLHVDGVYRAVVRARWSAAIQALCLPLLALCACAGPPSTAAPTSSTPTNAVALPGVVGGDQPAGATTAATAALAGDEVALPSVSGGDATPTAETETQAAGAAATSAATSVVALPAVEGGAGATVVPDATIAATIGEERLELQVVATPETRAQGLMFYSELPQSAGMLFVFPQDSQQSFWMRNTFIPLSVAFLDAERRILNIEDMQPLDEQTFHNSAGPARYALEVNQGWFAARGIGPGAVVEFTLPPDLAVR
jgi:uncharacterized membrane protein (UPF0127 family)